MRSQRIDLAGVPNARDLGGIRNKDGLTIRPYKLIRSSRLWQAGEQDLQTLYDTYRVRTIVDFRSDKEAEEAPDPAYRDIRYFHNNIINAESYGITQDKESQEKFFREYVKRMKEDASFAIAHMDRLYRQQIDNAYSVSQYAKFLSYVLQEDESILWHCSLGKDRCGIATVLILEILDVDRDTILEDYLYTNQCLNTHLLTGVKRITEETRPEYLAAFYDQAEKQYGGMSQLLEAMGVDQTVKLRFKEKYLM